MTKDDLIFKLSEDNSNLKDQIKSMLSLLHYARIIIQVDSTVLAARGYNVESEESLINRIDEFLKFNFQS